MVDVGVMKQTVTVLCVGTQADVRLVMWWYDNCVMTSVASTDALL